MLLELFGHVVCDLTDGVEGSVSNLGVGMGAVLNNYGNHNLDLFWVVNVLTNLTEGHDAGVLVPPVLVV